ncbi:MAG: UDP-N-acetylglucosamine 2-epimerase (non-hydrolyzing) [bacterium]
MKKIAVIFGTRPDTIKLAPVILELQKSSKQFKVLTIATAQHRQMLDQVLSVFHITPDYDLNIMQAKQSLASIVHNTIKALDAILEQERPDLVLVQGDTTTTFVGSLAAFYRKIPVGHVEAGLRTYDKFNPFPEEINRRLTGTLTDLHFAPTQTSKRALLKENIHPKSIFVTGNTVIDALKMTVTRRHTFSLPVLTTILAQKKRIILVTLHRRENWGEPMKSACRAIRAISEQHQDINIIFPVHLNPIVQEVVHATLGNLDNVYLVAPLEYPDFVNVIARSFLIITDSGGVQEEGPHFGIPILVIRKVTERPEAVEYGTVKLVGTGEKKLLSAAERLITNTHEYRKMASAINPYGDGLSSKRIVQIIKYSLGISRTKIKEFVPGKKRKQ